MPSIRRAKSDARTSFSRVIAGKDERRIALISRSSSEKRTSSAVRAGREQRVGKRQANARRCRMLINGTRPEPPDQQGKIDHGRLRPKEMAKLSGPRTSDFVTNAMLENGFGIRHTLDSYPRRSGSKPAETRSSSCALHCQPVSAVSRISTCWTCGVRGQLAQPEGRSS